MQPNTRKRVVSSCIPCYTRKQKCNRRYPCDHCSRRRRPEECAYYPSQVLRADTTPPRSQAMENHGNENQIIAVDDNQLQCLDNSDPNVSTLSDWNSAGRSNSTVSNPNDSFAELFGYFEYSESNTMALVRQLGLNENSDLGNQDLTAEASQKVQKHMASMPDRQILDFLVQYYMDEVHWIEQLVHPPWFLAQYQQLWSLGQLSSVFYVEFVVLLMRLCSYASQFLPSPSYTIDRIRNMFLADIRTVCDDIAEKLASICARFNPRGSLLRVQHLAFLGLRWQCEGRNNTFWETLSSAILVAQKAGLHRNDMASMPEMHELEKEMRCRVFCNLYIWDSLLSRQLDRIPFLPTALRPDNLPRMHLTPNINNTDAPEAYSERLIQARLADFWRSLSPTQDEAYDAAVAEERYKKFCTQFLATLPPVFAIEPSEGWDERLPRLPLQRQILHIAIFESLCHNFRSLLLRKLSHIESLPAYKQVQLSSQKKALALAALKVLDGVSKLHAMLGGSHTRFPGIVLPTFEAAVVLVSVCRDPEFPAKGGDGPLNTPNIDPLGSGKARVTRKLCLRAAQDALTRLRTLAEISAMAEGGASTLSRLLGSSNHSLPPKSPLRLPNVRSEHVIPPPSKRDSIQSMQPSSSIATPWPSSVEPPSSSDLSTLSDFVFTPPTEMSPSWEMLVAGLHSSITTPR